MGPISRLHLFLLGLQATSVISQGTSETLSCPENWLYIQKICYGVFDTRSSWEDAESSCQKFGPNAHLSSILRETEAALISRHILDKHPGSEGIWIGLHDPHQSGKWRWADSSTVHFLPWIDAVNPTKWIQSCAMLTYVEDFTKWKSAPCALRLRFMCSLPLE